MRLLIVLGITCIALLFSACAKSGGSSDSASDPGANSAGTDPNSSSSKNLFSVWTEETNLFSLDFRSAQFGVTSQVFITSGTVGSCTCQVVIQGTQNSGSMIFSNCTNGAAGCISLRPSGNYTKSGGALQLCTSTSCINMR